MKHRLDRLLPHPDTDPGWNEGTREIREKIERRNGVHYPTQAIPTAFVVLIVIWGANATIEDAFTRFLAWSMGF